MKLSYGIIALVSILFLGFHAEAQTKFGTKTGHIWFFSSTPLEDIEAHNYSTNSVLDYNSGKMEFAVLVKSFQFEKSLMQSHFNEDYMESDKYPKATFKGVIKDFDVLDLSRNGNYNVTVAGDLTMHGVTNKVSVPGTITVVNGLPRVNATFNVAVADYSIRVPSSLVKNIASIIKVEVDVAYEAL